VREHPDPVGQEAPVGGVANVGFDHGRVDPQPPAPDDLPLSAQRHQPGHHVLEHRGIEEVRQPDQRLGIRHPLAIDPAEGAVDQVPPHLALALVEAPVMQVLEDEHPQDHGGRRPQAAPTPTLWMPLPQRLRHAIDEDLVLEKIVDPFQGPRACRRRAGALPRGCVAGTLAAPWRLR